MLMIISINIVLVVITVSVHYEILDHLTQMLARFTLPHRLKVILSLLGALVAHAIEVWLFALAYYFINRVETFGTLSGNIDGSLLDCVYFSFTSYTSLGLGDIEPLGNIRYIVGIESLLGLVLIAWTASFIFVKMERSYRK